MEENTIFVRIYEPNDEGLAINEKEIWRYSGYLGMTDVVDEELKKILTATIEEVESAVSYKVCYRRMKIDWKDGMPVLPFSSQSKNLAKCLAGSSEIVIFAATVGLGIDRFIARYQRLSQVKALLLQAYGAERVETLCDLFCKQIKEEVSAKGLSISARFSPGYGDLSLETQKEIFALLDCNRKIGISLNESLLMTPSKSVTAIFGLGSCVNQKNEHKCSNCLNTDCEFRDQTFSEGERELF